MNNCTSSFCNAVKQICISNEYDMENSCDAFLMYCPYTTHSRVPCCNGNQANVISMSCRKRDYNSAREAACPLWDDCQKEN